MAKSSKELLNKRKKREKKQRTSSKKRENIVCIMRVREKKKDEIKFINVHEIYENATVGVLFVSCC
jgi:hypothetical protein